MNPFGTIVAISVIIIGLVGLAGGILAIKTVVNNTKGKREKQWMLLIGSITYISTITFLFVFFLAPSPYNSLACIPYFVLFLPFWIKHVNQRQKDIQKDEISDTILHPNNQEK